MRMGVSLALRLLLAVFLIFVALPPPKGRGRRLTS